MNRVEFVKHTNRIKNEIPVFLLVEKETMFLLN